MSPVGGHAARPGQGSAFDPKRTWAIMEPMVELRASRDPAVDFTAQRHKVDGFCQ
jgi:hypothetical protein